MKNIKYPIQGERLLEAKSEFPQIYKTQPPKLNTENKFMQLPKNLERLERLKKLKEKARKKLEELKNKKLPKSNTRATLDNYITATLDNYTPEQIEKMKEHAKEFVKALNSQKKN